MTAGGAASSFVGRHRLRDAGEKVVGYFTRFGSVGMALQNADGRARR